MLTHRLGGTLVGLFAGGVVFYGDIGGNMPVDRVDGGADVRGSGRTAGEAGVKVGRQLSRTSSTTA